MRIYRPGFLFTCLYPEALTRIKTRGKIVYLTFDDGPNPSSTPLLLTILKESNVTAMFFCNGRAAEKYLPITENIRKEGHVTGNHGYDHLNGWLTPTPRYVENVRKSSGLLSDRYFRPPFGKMTREQYHLLKSYKLILWDIMLYDFDKTLSKKSLLITLKNMIRPGSIIVLHDTADSMANEIIADLIRSVYERGYKFGDLGGLIGNVRGVE